MDVTSVAEQLLFTTVRLETCSSTGSNGVGTAFIFSKEVEEGNAAFLVTNRHIVEDAEEGMLFFTKADEGIPRIGDVYRLRVDDFDKRFTFHPDPEVDVAITPFVPLLDHAERNGIRIYHRAVGWELIPPLHQWRGFDALEDVVFIGYPNGIWDEVNNLPVMRRGTTATPIAIDFNGKPQFLVDAAVFPGSSGSPVFLYNTGSYGRKEGGAVLGSRLFFLGVITAVFFREDTGRIEMADVPAARVPVSVFRQMINLGIVFKSQTVAETVDHFLRLAESK